MFDKDTLIVSFDEQRGTPIAKGKKRKELGDQAGDCIDCSLCVQVCPTGIDIREGLQYECIGCAACIDVCDQVMDKVDMPHGLIRYTTEHSLEHEKTKILRPRIIAYAALLSALFVAFVIAIAMRSPLAVDILRDRGALYRVLDASNIENVYNFKVMNKSKTKQNYRIEVNGIPDARVHYDTQNTIAPGEVANLTVSVSAPVDSLSNPIENLDFTIFTRIAGQNFSVNESSRFFSPR
jgi:cytochrome c oxidase accessory protein FixG